MVARAQPRDGNGRWCSSGAVKKIGKKHSALSTAGRWLRRASPSWSGGSNGEVKASGHARSVPAMEGHGFQHASPSSSDGSNGDVKLAMAAPTGGPSSCSRGRPELSSTWPKMTTRERGRSRFQPWRAPRCTLRRDTGRSRFCSRSLPFLSWIRCSLASREMDTSVSLKLGILGILGKWIRVSEFVILILWFSHIGKFRSRLKNERNSWRCSSVKYCDSEI